MAKEQKTLLLVDGSSYLYRAFHAMPSLTNSKGVPTGAAYGICNMLRRILAERAPDYMAVVFDAKGKTFRDDMFAEYKATRPPMPDELRSQIQPIHDLVDAMGIPRLVVPGVEADDVIGTLAREATGLGIDTIMSTSDKDMAQLVDEHVLMANTMDGSSLDIAGVEGKFGVPPQRIVDYLALIGDTSDNVPGVPKVGPKTAAKWLAEHGSLDGVVENADKIKGKVGESLREHLEQIPLSRELVTIRCDVPLEVTVDALLVRESDVARLRELYAQLEFKTWLSEVLEEGDVTPSAPTSEAHYETVSDEPALERWLQRLDDAALFSFDTETTSLNYMQAEIVGVSFAVSAGEAAYVPLAHHYAGVPPQLDRDSVLARLKPFLEDPTRAKVGQNLKYDMSVLARHGIELAGARFDTMLESYVLDSTATRHDMDSLALKYLGHKTIHFEEVAGKGKNQLRFDEVPVEQAGPYAAEDADITLRLHHALWPKIRKQERLLALFRDLEMPLVPVLSQIERTGVKVDARLLAQQSAEVFDRLGELEREAYEEAGQPFNLGSPKQLQVILFEQLNLPVISKTPKGQPSTAESVLQELAHDHALPHLILEHRALSKLRSTYLDSLPQCIDPVTGRVHTSYHQAVASTGRLSSSDPNLQNIPIRRPEGRRVRQAFVAEEGCCLLAADYSQIELRIMAHLSGDEGLVAAFAAGEDVHRATAAEVFGVELEQVTGDQRRNAKAINFGLIYGMSAFGLARQLGIGRSEAQTYVDLYFERYPGVKAYMDRTREQAHETGFVETVFGRRLYLSEINSSNGQRRQAAERTAINAPMQGTAADIIKRAMLGVQDWLCGAGLNARIIMQVHDELVLEVARECVDEVREQVVELMSGAAKLDVGLVVDTGVGANWDEAHQRSADKHRERSGESGRGDLQSPCVCYYLRSLQLVLTPPGEQSLMLLIPAIDIQDGRCVRLRQGRMDDATVFSDDPVAMARRWADAGARRLHVVDLDGAVQGFPVNLSVIQAIIEAVPELPVQVGGGIRDEDAIEEYVGSGVRYVILGSKAAAAPHFVADVCVEFPGHIIVGLDGRDGKVATHGWSKLSQHDVIDLAQHFERDGVESIIFTDIGRDGMLSGVNIEATVELARAVSIPIIASGGITSLDDVRALSAVAAEGIMGAITGRAIYEGTLDFEAGQKLADELVDDLPGVSL